MIMESFKKSLFLFSVVLGCRAANLDKAFPGYSFPAGQPTIISTVSRGLSEECRQTVQNLDMNQRWAYIDASGKPKSGILGGNVQWFGSFDQCLSIPASRYCLAALQGKFGSNQSHSALYGVCVPDVCDKQDVAIGIENFLENVTHRYFPTLHVIGKYSASGINCYEEPSYTAGVVLTIVFCGIILALCGIGTIIEVIQETFGNVKEHRVLAHRSNDDTGKSPEEYLNELAEHDILKIAEATEVTPLLKQPSKFNGVIGRNNELSESVRLKGVDENEKQTKLKPNNNVEKATESQNILVAFFLCFSLLRNSRRVFNTDLRPSTITSLNGIRVISLFWVILGHTFSTARESVVVVKRWNFDNDLKVPFQNSVFLLKVKGGEVGLLKHYAVKIKLFNNGCHKNTPALIRDGETLSMMAVTNAFFSVDSFFFMSGFLLAYNVFMRLEKNNGEIHWGWFYLHRYLRLTPTLMFVILFVIQLEPFVDKSPLWFTQVNDQRCSDYWWTNLLYINNFYPTDVARDSCLPWTWYLAIDMQIFITAPIIIYLFHRYGLKGVIGTSLFTILVSATIIAALLVHYDLDPMIVSRGNLTQEAADLFNYIYTKPYCRIQPYIIGLAFGYLIHTKFSKTKMLGWPLAILFWILAIATALSLVYGPHDAVKKHPRHWTMFEKILYGSTRHLLWGVALAWVTYACEYGYGGYVKEFLSAKFWIPLSRLTYSAYLINNQLLVVMFIGYRTGLHYSRQLMAYIYCSSLVLSYAIAFILVVTVEFPCANIEAMVRKRKSTQK